jgi:hypothetical protein
MFTKDKDKGYAICSYVILTTFPTFSNPTPFEQVPHAFASTARDLSNGPQFG